MVCGTEEHKVFRAGRAAVRPMMDVVGVDEAPVGAARKATAPVPQPEGAAQGPGNGAGAPADVFHRTVPVVSYANHDAVAGQPAERFRGNARAVVEGGREA